MAVGHSEETIIPFPGQNNKSIGRFLLDHLHQSGVEHIFGIPGDYIIRFDQLIEEHPIQFVNTSRENTAGYMADAYARLKGIGVACITYGVGINIVNATAQAYAEGVPLVIVSGAAGSQEFHNNPYLHHMINSTTHQSRDLSQLEIFKQVTVDQAVLDNPKTAAHEIGRTVHSCRSEQKPVYIELPRDMVDAPLPPSAPFTPPQMESDQESLAEALKEILVMLEGSNHPAIWVGREVYSFGLMEEVLKFAERFQIPIVSTLLGKTVIDERHPLFVGVYQGGMSRPEVEEFVNQSDCLIMLGVLRTDVDTGFQTAKIDIAQRIIASARRIAIAHHQYPKVYFTDFIRSLPKLPMSRSFQEIFPKNCDRLQYFEADRDKTITTSRMLACLQSHVKAQHIIATDCGDCLFAGADFILGQNSYLSPAYFATMGYGIPAAIGGAIAEPERRVIALVGDGGFQMTATELTTALRYGADPIIVVMNNHGFGTERPLIEGEFNEVVNWNYSKIFELLGGGKGARVTTEGEFEIALRQALEQRGSFFVIEVELDKFDFSPALERFKKLAKKSLL